MIENIEDFVFEIENFIPKEYQDAIEAKILHSDFPWYYKEDVTRTNPTDKFDAEVSNPGFSHGVYQDTSGVASPKVHPLILPLYFFIKEKTSLKTKELLRFRLGLCTRNSSLNLHHKPHLDRWHKHWTALYYINDSDGDTFVFNETNPEFDKCLNEEYISANNWTIKKRITPQKGKLSIFNGKYYHASSSPTKSNGRVVLTINFSTED